MGAPTIRVFDDPETLARAAAEAFARIVEEAVASRGRFVAAVSGGTTPRRTYETLAEGGDPPYRARLPWDSVWLFSGDERAVPPDDPQNNYRMLHRALLSKVPIPAGNVARFWSEGEPPDVVSGYHENRIRDFFGLAPGAWPRFDLVLLGMGADGHTASLFPGSEAVEETTRLAVAPWVESMGARRYSITLPVINHAAEVMFLVAGRDKADALRRVLEGGPSGAPLPAARVAPAGGRVTWMLDREAASALSHRP